MIRRFFLMTGFLVLVMTVFAAGLYAVYAVVDTTKRTGLWLFVLFLAGLVAVYLLIRVFITVVGSMFSVV